MPEESVKVAVRVRPFNKRERARNAVCIVNMNGMETKLTDPEDPNGDPRKFAFDFSYWSFDGCKERGDGYYEPDTSHPNGKKFCDQNTVFKDLGMGVLANAWEGFNSTLFAYGQTGSGKSWSVVGYGINKGIVPLFCEKIFSQIEEKKAGGDVTEFQVLFSMLEIYNEEVRDLLGPSVKGGLKVRENPKLGFYAEGLSTHPVANYSGIEAKMEEGTSNRTVAATQMNATSSRAHTVVAITFVQKYKNAAGAETAKTAVCNLVDLAGSERAENTGATGDRLKEGAAINQSLSSLGNCIAALADQSSGKRVRVPFRDSVLTKLLKNALGGNSKTVMIAAISPADINYAESLSTLRYADRAKQIKCKAIVNEDPTEKLIRELNEENARLKALLESGGIEVPEGNGEHGIEKQEGASKSEIDAMKKELEEEYAAALAANEAKMAEMQRNFEDMLKEEEEGNSGADAARASAAEKKKAMDYLTNLNMDPALSGYITHFLEKDSNTLGSKRGETSDICLPGPIIQQQHAIITKEGGKYSIEKCSEAARCLVNGEPLQEKRELSHLDRLMFGTTQLYVFVDHTKFKSGSLPEYEDAMEEIALSAGFDEDDDDAEKSPDEFLLKEDMIEILPAIEEANSISEEMDKKLRFEAAVVSAESRGELTGRPQLFVHVANIETGLQWFWPREKFYNRAAVMKELFNQFDDDDDDFDGNLADEKDPFTMDPKENVHIGSFKVFLKSLSYNIEMVEQLDIIDYNSQQIGVCNVEVRPCTAKGKVFRAEDDVFVDDPEQLIGQEFHFKVKIASARGLPLRYTDIFAKFQLKDDPEYNQTKAIAGTSNPDWKLEKIYSFKPLTAEDLKYLMDGCFMVQIYGKQVIKEKKSVNTKKAGRARAAARCNVPLAGKSIKRKMDPAAAAMQQFMGVANTRNKKLNNRLEWLKDLLRAARQKNKKKIPIHLVIAILEAKNHKEAKKIIASLGRARGGGRGDNRATSPQSQETLLDDEKRLPGEPCKKPPPGKSVNRVHPEGEDSSSNGGEPATDGQPMTNGGIDSDVTDSKPADTKPADAKPADDKAEDEKATSSDAEADWDYEEEDSFFNMPHFNLTFRLRL